MKAIALCFGAVAFAFAAGAAAAPSCIDDAADRGQLEACALKLLAKKQAATDAEYARLARAHAGNDEMLEVLRVARESYQGYINMQCIFEGAATAGTTGKKEIRASLGAQKAFYRCIDRVADDAYAGLERLR